LRLVVSIVREEKGVVMGPLGMVIGVVRDLGMRV
jgi:hypothetical protein